MTELRRLLMRKSAHERGLGMRNEDYEDYDEDYGGRAPYSMQEGPLGGKRKKRKGKASMEVAQSGRNPYFECIQRCEKQNGPTAAAEMQRRLNEAIKAAEKKSKAHMANFSEEDKKKFDVEGAGKRKRKRRTTKKKAGASVGGKKRKRRVTKKKAGACVGGKKRKRRTTKKKAGVLLGGKKKKRVSKKKAGSHVGGKKPRKGVTPSHLKPWLNHVKKVRAKYPKLTYGEVLHKAKASF